MILYIGLFFMYSFLGGIIDVIYCSLLKWKYSFQSVFPFFAPAYGFGGISLTLFFHYTSVPFFVHILLGTLLVILVEFLGGVFCVQVLKKRYWDYSEEPYTLLGHIDVLHSIILVIPRYSL